ncbi:hypothetical protein EYF80_024232 [Liparis tanakae]|uniref:Uncharacterized protein n=1 Tax=Liparis tanakae TaxID=230148 RepID=A0A4Z2HKU3_9TELE|nr:hypothetical protein EYF80_024232 [Liparis tanakae]
MRAQWQKRLEKCTRTLSLSWVSPISGKAFKKVLSHRNDTAGSTEVSGHVAALEALEVIEALGEPLGGPKVGSAAIGQRVGAAALQALLAAQIALLRVCKVALSSLFD